MEEIVRDLILKELGQSEALKKTLRSRAITCVCCSLIVGDLEQHGKLTGWPFDSLGGSTYTIDGKLRHLHLELVGPIPESVEDGKTLLPALVINVRSL